MASLSALALETRTADVARSFLPRPATVRAETEAPAPRPAEAHELDAVLHRRSFLQARLEVGRSDDPREHEADRIAERVVGMTAPEPALAASQSGRLVARQSEDVASMEDLLADEELDEQDDSEPDEYGMPKREAGTAPGATDVAISRRGGEPLPTRAYFEPRFGRDFAPVQVHTGPSAVASARHLRAQAFTVGTDIFFNAGRFAPHTGEGRLLLAHELAHVVQQGGAEPLVERKPDPKKKKKDPPKSICAAGSCPQGKQPKVVHNDCADSTEADSTSMITHLDVSLGSRTVTPTWSGTPKGAGAGPWECSPNPAHTPKTPAKGQDLVGVKCTIDHTNMKKDGMAWFTSIRRHGYAIGFHNSQPVGSSFKSHGCIRVCCDVAQTINENTSSDVTTVNVS